MGCAPGGNRHPQHQFSVEGQAYVRNAVRSLRSLKLNPKWDLTTNSQHKIGPGAFTRTEDLHVSFRLPEPTGVPVGRCDFRGLVSYRPLRYNLRLNAEVAGGGIIQRAARYHSAQTDLDRLPASPGQRPLSAQPNPVSRSEPGLHGPCQSGSSQILSARSKMDSTASNRDLGSLSWWTLATYEQVARNVGATSPEILPRSTETFL